MLHQRQAVWAGAHVVEQACDQVGLDPAVEHMRGVLDRLVPLLASQPGSEVQALVQRLWKALEHGTLADVVRAHRQDDVDGHFPLPSGGQQERHEGVGLVAIAVPPVAEDLFELIDQKEQFSLAGGRRLGGQLG